VPKPYHREFYAIIYAKIGKFDLTFVIPGDKNDNKPTKFSQKLNGNGSGTLEIHKLHKIVYCPMEAIQRMRFFKIP